MAPVTAQVIMTLRAMENFLLGDLKNGLRFLVGLQGSKAAVPPRGPMREDVGSGRIAPCVQYPADILFVPNLRAGRIGSEPAIKSGIAGAVIGNAAGCIKFDGLERPEERPAQPEAI